MVKTMKNDLGIIIAHREYYRASDLNIPVVELTVGKPIPSPHANDEFQCPYKIKSPGFDETNIVFGIDELQALQLALAAAAARISSINSSLGLDLRWVGDEHGDLGIKIPAF